MTLDWRHAVRSADRTDNRLNSVIAASFRMPAGMVTRPRRAQRRALPHAPDRPGGRENLCTGIHNPP